MSRFIPQLNLNAYSVNLTLSASAGQAQIPDTAQRIGVYTPYTSGSIRIGFVQPQSASTVVTGSALTANFRAGVLITGNTWNWFDVGFGNSRVLYFTATGSATPIVTIAYT